MRLSNLGFRAWVLGRRGRLWIGCRDHIVDYTFLDVLSEIYRLRSSSNHASRYKYLDYGIVLGCSGYVVKSFVVRL